jgi:hypothetical protein
VPKGKASTSRLRNLKSTTESNLDQYRKCRIFGHAWGYTRAKRVKGEYFEGLACMRCGVQRSVRIDAHNGDRLRSGGYDYNDAPGYLLKGGEPLTADERSELRLLEVMDRC